MTSEVKLDRTGRTGQGGGGGHCIRTTFFLPEWCCRLDVPVTANFMCRSSLTPAAPPMTFDDDDDEDDEVSGLARVLGDEDIPILSPLLLL